MALFPGLSRSAGTRKVKPLWILLKKETVSGSGISWARCKSSSSSRQITMPAPHHSVFYRPDALPAAQPTASKHWRQLWDYTSANCPSPVTVHDSNKRQHDTKYESSCIIRRMHIKIIKVLKLVKTLKAFHVSGGVWAFFNFSHRVVPSSVVFIMSWNSLNSNVPFPDHHRNIYLWFMLKKYLHLQHRGFLNINISQGSVATRLGCGGAFKYDFVTNFLLSLTVKEFWKSVNIWQSYRHEYSVLFFWLTVYK